MPWEQSYCGRTFQRLSNLPWQKQAPCLFLVMQCLLQAASYYSIFSSIRNWRSFFKLSKKQFFSCFLLCSILFIYYQSLFIGYAGLPVQIAQPVNYSWTLMLALISSFIFKQKLSGKEIFWILFAYTGVLIISLGNSSTIMQANSLSLFIF